MSSFSDLSQPDRAYMRSTAYANNQRFGSGEIILFPGRSAAVYRVTEGLVRIHTVDDEGNGLTLRYVKPGGFFGEEALYANDEGAERRYFAEAVTGAVIETLEPSELSATDHAELAAHLATAMSRLYRSLYRLSGKRLKSRIAAELLELQDSTLATVNPHEQAVVHITHDDLAAAVGSVRETVTKVVGELSRAGAIDAGYGKLVLIDVAQLETIADS